MGAPRVTVRRPRPARKLVRRKTERFLQNPPTVRRAAGVIVTMTTLIVVGSAIAMRVFDHREFASIWVSLWWAVQTVTTVGYGDVAPHKPIGRVIATIVMLEGVAFLAVVTASITSTFVARAQHELDVGEGHALGEIAERLQRIEELLERDHPNGTMPPEDARASIGSTTEEEPK
jgi:voltage-gated potassium channel